MTGNSKKILPIIHDRREREAGKMLRVEQVDLEFSNGERRTYHRLKPSGLGAVIIVPMLDNETVLLAREYAAGLHHYEIGLPKGRLEEGESIIEAAQREMKEEIGYGARDLIELTRLSLAPGYMTHITWIVLARDLYPREAGRRRTRGTRSRALAPCRPALIDRPRRLHGRPNHRRLVYRA